MASSLPPIRLNDRERQLRRLLIAVAKSIDKAGHVGQPVVLRWAGGWVRDRLLGVESNDIDVAINAMTGVQFAEVMCKYCDTESAIESHGIGTDDIGNLHNVARNPDKSKHLETAMVRMFGLDIDFVNLRKETYVQDSRNPLMEFGTAEEDALRRDATINALFYNLNTESVEDFTGGEADLAAGLVRTPLDPYQTFMDDPLRVLRLVRFASRFSFVIDPETERVMAHQEVLAALKAKVSRERVGIELEKMLKGPYPQKSLELLDRVGLYHAVFTDPMLDHISVPNTSRWHTAYDCLDDLMKNNTRGSVAEFLVRGDDATYVAWNLAAVSPWMTVKYLPGLVQKNNSLALAAKIAREGFKAPNKLTSIITASQRHRAEINRLKIAVCKRELCIHDRGSFGMAIRRWEANGGSWRLQVLCTLLTDAMEQLEIWPGLQKQPAYDFILGWEAFLNHLEELDVCNAPTLKPLLDGRGLAEALGIKPGKWTGKALDVCMEWQLRHPEASGPSGAVQEVRGRSVELEIPL